MKKKKKKKTTFDLDAALEGDSQDVSSPADALEPESNENNADGIDDLDLENFGKKKRKKKKTGFNLDDLDAALPTATDDGDQEESGAGQDDEVVIDDTFDLGILKKKKKKKTEINELLKDNKENEELENGKNWPLKVW